MIQRIQSIYLLCCLLAQSALVFFDMGSHPFLLDFISNELILGTHIFTIALTFISLFLFKNRLYQLMCSRIVVLMLLIKLVAAVYNGIEGGVDLQLLLLFSLELLSVLLVFLAQKAIKKDEDLVRSVDRIR